MYQHFFGCKVELLRTCALFFVLIATTQTCVAQPLELKNDHLTARFGPSGMRSIQENGGPDRNILSDNFSVQIDSQVFDSATAQPTIRQHDPNQISYLFREGDNAAEVTYRLEPSWRFISKQIRIVATTRPEFVVRRFEPIDLKFIDTSKSIFVPGTYLPQFGPLPPGRENPANDYGAFIRFADRSGILLLVQNPFLHVSHERNRFRLQYEPGLPWKASWGQFKSDVACIGPYTTTGYRLPAKMTYEWKLPGGLDMPQGADRAEVKAFQECVKAFLIDQPFDPITVEVGWTMNDYQIDVANENGRAEYKRIIDSTAALGIRNLVYSPSNSAIAKREDDADSWKWEHILWLGLGQKLRQGKWSVETGQVPSSVSEMLDYARSKHVGLLAYVYPSLPFIQNQNWLVKGDFESQNNSAATLASREFQDFLITTLIKFKKRTRIAGYSFDYAFLNLPGSTAYSQWFGWCRVLESLRRNDPAMVIDGRQSYQEYGPWSWLAGNYPHPTGNDEQPESFIPYPDLHFDRVSADRTRFVNYWYRNYQFAPEQIVPGYMTHQTERSENRPPDARTGGNPGEAKLMEGAYRRRDWDYLGYKYSVLSSIATAGWNNVVDLIPARDEEEARAFHGSVDERWIQSWLRWTIGHKAYLEQTTSILGCPAIGKADGTAAIIGDHGYVFLFNPNYKHTTVQFPLDAQIGLNAGSEFLIRELFPNEGRIIGKPGAGIWQRGDNVDMELDGTSATVIEISSAPRNLHEPLVVNAATHSPDSQPSAIVSNGGLKLDHVFGEPGTSIEIGALLTVDDPIRRLTINGKASSFKQRGRYVSAIVQFAGTRFGQAQQVDLETADSGVYNGTFVIPNRIIAQRKAIQNAWPIPWRPEDYETTWLAPDRLLLFVQFAEPKPTVPIALTLDDTSTPLTKAYSSVRAHSASFVGFYVDVSSLRPDVTHRVKLYIPSGSSKQFQGLFFDNVQPELTAQVQQ